MSSEQTANKMVQKNDIYEETDDTDDETTEIIFKQATTKMTKENNNYEEISDLQNTEEEKTIKSNTAEETIIKMTNEENYAKDLSDLLNKAIEITDKMMLKFQYQKINIKAFHDLKKNVDLYLEHIKYTNDYRTRYGKGLEKIKNKIAKYENDLEKSIVNNDSSIHVQMKDNMYELNKIVNSYTFKF